VSGAGLRRALLPLSWAYGAAVSVRNRRYDRTPSLAGVLPVSVLSVGNLTVGGSGKTPLVAALARELLARGLPVAALSRGYGRRSRSPFVLVSDGTRISATPEESGDEPYELASSVPGLAVAVGSDRYQVGRRLLDELGPHVILLDDGFQHRRLHRDVDLVCLDAEEPDSSMHLLPVGRLREPVANLERAHALVWTRWREGLPSAELRDRVLDAAGRDRVQIRSCQRIAGLTRVDVDEGGEIGLEALGDGPVGVLLGVARPERVLAGLTQRVVLRAVRPDHYGWESEEVRELAERAGRDGAKALLTTWKDAVKMLRLRLAGGLALPLFAIRIETEIVEIDRPLLSALLDRISRP
jgi:tetraacyldisaccharide 4'-kinase